ncbi:hypothetical protein D187_006729 [Cystobacter fuscus DSM 2262]|uniref:Lipoprotein n=1 Tax=Cystobacter fuscus (strain ATCC 25194 / DSM 2262 / NBRC 100088 / M29) TaxID=1242864 RepID=S9NXM2_CYSF2|nr:hypothetical protein [Cystobacter fuscus]EPX56975.1 hypothetical protein D187_006729 [Cystobacter fuscus DSM 2262]
MMRTRLLLLGCLATACGGNISNDDLQFLNALPTRELLSAKLPGAESVRRMGISRQRVDSLALGEPSRLYDITRQAADEFNGGFDGVLSILEETRKSPPTTRAPELRIWGPAQDPGNPGHEMRIMMTREAERFDYRVQFRPMGSDEEAWWSALVGSFQSEGGPRQGKGTLSIFMAEVMEHGLNVPWMSDLKRLDIDYQTSTLPSSVRMHFIPVSGFELDYAYHEFPGGSGEMRFSRENLDIYPGEQKETLAILSRWTQDQGGMAIVEATGGDVPTDFTVTLVECWDASFRTTYEKRSWDADEEGNASSCPDVSPLGE